jgi:hypothetical protein
MRPQVHYPGRAHLFQSVAPAHDERRKNYVDADANGKRSRASILKLSRRGATAAKLLIPKLPYLQGGAKA